MEAFGRGDAKAALKSFDEALKAAPGDAETLVDRAVALDALGRLDEAVDAGSRAVSAAEAAYQTERTELLPSALSSRASLYLKQGRKDLAAQDLRRAYELAPETWPLRAETKRRAVGAGGPVSKAAGREELSRAIQLFEEGRYAEALAGFKACVRHGDSAEVQEYLRKAAAHLKHGAVGVREDPGLGAALDARDFSAAAAHAEALFAGDKRLAYRALRDHFLKGVQDVPETAADTAFGCFFSASQAWKHGRTLEALERLARGAAFGASYAWMRYYAAELLMRRADLYAPAREELDAVVKAAHGSGRRASCARSCAGRSATRGRWRGSTSSSSTGRRAPRCSPGAARSSSGPGTPRRPWRTWTRPRP